MLARFKVVGLPTVVLFDSHGNEGRALQRFRAARRIPEVRAARRLSSPHGVAEALRRDKNGRAHLVFTRRVPIGSVMANVPERGSSGRAIVSTARTSSSRGTGLSRMRGITAMPSRRATRRAQQRRPVAVAAEQEHALGQLRVALADAHEQLRSAHARHRNIRDHGVKMAAICEPPERLGGAARRHPRPARAACWRSRAAPGPDRRPRARADDPAARQAVPAGAARARCRQPGRCRPDSATRAPCLSRPIEPTNRGEPGAQSPTRRLPMSHRNPRTTTNELLMPSECASGAPSAPLTAAYIGVARTASKS